MRIFTIVMLAVFVISISGFSQEDKLRFVIDGDLFLTIKKNAGGFNTFDQSIAQSSMFFGYNSGANTIVDPGVFNSGNSNVAFGSRTLTENTTGFQNTAIGTNALRENISGTSNVGVGFGALYNGTTGILNVGIGKSAMYANMTGSYNVAIGGDVLSKTNTATRSVAIGATAALNDTSSVDNVYVGFGAGRGTLFVIDGFDRSKNVMLGSFAGHYCQTNGNVFLGHQAGLNSNADNQLYITNSGTDSLTSLIYGQFDNDLLRINGDLNIDGLYTLPKTALSVGQYLGYNGGANLTWGSIDEVWSFGAGNDAVYEDGDVGVGIANPIFQLDVQDDVFNGYITRFHNTNTASNSKGIIIRAGMNANPATSTYYALFRDGSGTDIGGVRGDGAGGILYSTTSDKRLKQNIQTFDQGLATLEKINPTIYQRKSKPDQDEVGFIAQDLYKVVPQMVGGHPNDRVEESPMTVDYGRLTPVLVAAVKEQQAIIVQQQITIEQQQTLFRQEQNRVDGLLERLESLNTEFEELKVEISRMKGIVEK